jgi:DNA-binding winged helix-turn-helix (wHTH) protein
MAVTGTSEIRTYRVGDRTIDVARREIRAGNGPIPLRKKAFDVLTFLIENRGRAVTKQELFTAVWERNHVSEDVLVGCIAAIRKALADNPAEPSLVTTVHGIGYRFTDEVEEAVSPGEDAGPVTTAKRAPHLWKAAAVAAVALALVLLTLPWRRAAPPVGEVAWWTFDETGVAVSDSTQAGNTGRIYGAVRRSPGKLGMALEFDGETGRVIGNDPGKALPRGSAPRTITAWIRATAPPVNDAGIFHYGSAGSSPPRGNFHLYLSINGKLGFGNGYGHGTVESRRIVADGAWHHVAGRYDGPDTNGIGVFVDGEPDGAVVLPATPATGAKSPWSIGIFQAGGLSFRGLIDDVRVFARGVGHGAIQSMYRCGRGTADLSLPIAGTAYYSNIQGSVISIDGDAGNATSKPIHLEGGTFGGVEFAIASADCRLLSVRGAALPADLRMSAELAPGTGQSSNSYAGFLLAARSAGPDEPVTGPEGQGVWARLSSDGEVSVLKLSAPDAVIAASQPVSGFDADVFHSLTVERRGHILRAWLDGASVRFAAEDSVVLPEEAIRGAAAGIAFEQKTPLFGRPPRARNIVVKAL